MANELPPLPAGFQLDASPSAPAPMALPALPAGFQLDQPAPTAEPQSFGAQLGSAAIRPIIHAVSALPGMAADAGVGLRNLSESAVNKFTPWLAKDIYAANRKIAGNSDIGAAILPQGPPSGGYELPTTGFNQAIDAAYQPPQTLPGKAAEFVNTALVGAKLPAPQAENPAPAAFMRATTPQETALINARKAGYVAPPTLANPSTTNKLLEGTAGKLSTGQAAAVKNQSVTNTLAAEALDLPKGTNVTKEVLTDLRSKAGQVYEQVGKSGDVSADEQYLTDLSKIGQQAAEVSKGFPDANVGASDQVTKLVNSMLQDKFSAKSAMEYLKQLRADAAGNLSPLAVADPAKRSLGSAQRDAAEALESMIKRHLDTVGQGDLGKKFEDARRLIAKSYSVENALNDSTGNVSAQVLGQQMKSGKPLSGPLEVSARFARAFPPAARETTSSMPGFSPLDVYASAGIGAATKNPLSFLVAPARAAARTISLSGPYQDSMVVPQFTGAPAQTLGGGPGSALAAQQDLTNAMEEYSRRLKRQ